MKYNLFSPVKRYFEENPDLLPTYVDWCIYLLNLTTIPLNKLLRHVLTVQGIDPNTTPGTKIKEKFLAELNQSLNKVHKKEYADNFDFKFITKKYNQVKDELNVSQDQFDELTNLNACCDPPPAPTDPIDDLINLIKNSNTNLNVPVDISPALYQNITDELGLDEVERLVERGDHLREFKKSIEQFGSEVMSDEYEAKLLNAQNLAEDMITRGLCDKKGFKNQVDELMKYEDEALQSIKRVVECHPYPMTPELQEVKEFVDDFNHDQDAKEAETIHKLVLEGKVSVSNFDALIREGLSAGAVSIWKQKYGPIHLPSNMVVLPLPADVKFKSFRRIPTRR